MDEEMRAFLEGMMGQINGRFDLILDQLSAMRADTALRDALEVYERGMRQEPDGRILYRR